MIGLLREEILGAAPLISTQWKRLRFSGRFE
nr:MAG TPA: hypothetical protein [Bacteriophage sp.]